MTFFRHHPAAFVLLFLSAVLVTAAASRYIEYDSGDILIHRVKLEADDGSIFYGRQYRPIKAGSLNQRPAVFITALSLSDKINARIIAIELSHRGFVVLESWNPETDLSIVLETAATYLQTRTFVRAEKTAVLIAGDHAPLKPDSTDLSVFQSAAFIPNEDKTGIIDIMDHFNDQLQINNDSPLWYTASTKLGTLYFIFLGLCGINLIGAIITLAYAVVRLFHRNKNKILTTEV